MKIYCTDNSERTQWETLLKGWRPDLIVESNGQYYSITVYDIVRLQQNFESELNENGYYHVDPNLVIVKEVTYNEIKKTVQFLEKGKYFESIKPLDNLDISGLEEYC